MHLSKDMVRGLILEKQLLTNYSDLDKQLTANGVDVRLAGIIEVLDAGKLAIEKSDNRLPKLGKALVLKGFEDRLDDYDVSEKSVVAAGSVKLEPLKAYLVMTCERVNTPSDLMIHAGPRSSLFRFTQSLMGLTFTEAGYKGYLTFLLFPILGGELELGARIAQLSFSQLTGESNYEDQKETNYQGGKIF